MDWNLLATCDTLTHVLEFGLQHMLTSEQLLFMYTVSSKILLKWKVSMSNKVIGLNFWMDRFCLSWSFRDPWIKGGGCYESLCLILITMGWQCTKRLEEYNLSTIELSGSLVMVAKQ